VAVAIDWPDDCAKLHYLWQAIRPFQSTHRRTTFSDQLQHGNVFARLTFVVSTVQAR
jgi:hypothetical protein